jgi:hypothetical protein
MPIDAPEQDFLHYLTCDLPLGYPLKTPMARLLTPTMTISRRRELLHRQAEFLDYAKQFLETHPWISYLATVKDEAVWVTIPTYESKFVDIVDVLYFKDTQQKRKELHEAARAALDEVTAQDCERLVLLQAEAVQIENAINNVGAAIRSGFTAVEPLPPPPPEPVPERRLLPNFVAIAVGCVVVGAVIPPYYGGMIWALTGLIVTGIIGFRIIGKEKARVRTENERFKDYLIHENYLVLCRKSVRLVLTLPFDTRMSALFGLPLCLTALEALLSEREALEARYIGPFSLK